MRKKHRLLAWALLLSMVIGLMPSLPATVRAANDGGSVVLNAMDYGADPTGAVDSTRAIQAALEAAREYEAAGKAVKNQVHISWRKRSVTAGKTWISFRIPHE